MVSDTHLYAPSLGTSGPAFELIRETERKLFAESPEILDEAMRMVREAGPGGAPQFLLVSGDLTKDGERESHLLLAAHLAALARDGIKVFVVPGNHDVLNPAASGYEGSTSHRVPNVTAAEFADIYRDCGYGDALYRDPGSLSYVAEPVPGLWLLAVDSADHDHNAGRARPVTGGGETPARMAWIRSMLARAREQGKAVIVMMHHGVVEHFPGYARWVPDYIVNNWREMGETLSAGGARLVFTGHFHAQDIAERAWSDGRVLYDVETGSLVTWPSPVRFVEIDTAGAVRISSASITSLPSFTAQGRDFNEWSKAKALADAKAVAASALHRAGMNAADADVLSTQAAEALLANDAGDEKEPPGLTLGRPGMGALARLALAVAGPLPRDIWNDPAPPDNALVIAADGAWSP